MSFYNDSIRQKTRIQLTNRRIPKLGYYLIVTDTKKTESLYFNGLFSSIKDKVGDKLVIKVIEKENADLIAETTKYLSGLSNFAKPWIVFDKDENQNFNNIIKRANDLKINCAWSNPCIEIRFFAYFGYIPNCKNSVECCKAFGKKFKDIFKCSYKKNNKDLYKKLFEKGDEENAVRNAELKIKEHSRNNNTIPSKMVPATTVYKLIKEIRETTKF